MDATLITVVSVGSILVFFVFASIARARGLARRGETITRARGVTQYVPYFTFVPYVVVAARPGPEIGVLESLRWVGLALIVGGVVFACWAIATLGRHYDVELEIHRDHEIVDRGPYRFVRHPVYTGLMLHFAGMCLATGNVVLILGTSLVTYPALYVRARAEEQLLRGRFGVAYDAYAKRVGMLVPLL